MCEDECMTHAYVLFLELSHLRFHLFRIHISLLPLVVSERFFNHHELIQLVSDIEVGLLGLRVS